MQTTHMQKWPVEKEKNIKIEPRIEVLFVFEVVPSVLGHCWLGVRSASD